MRNKKWEEVLRKAEEATGLPDVIHIHFPLMILSAEVFKKYHDKGVKIPKQTELISIGNGSRDHEEFSVPSLSVVSLPMEAMADACLARITRAITEMNLNPDSREFRAEYIARESCPY